MCVAFFINICNTQNLIILVGTFLLQKKKTDSFIHGRDQSGCEKVKNLGFLPLNLWVFLTIYIFVALMTTTMCFKQLEASHMMSLDS